ncbi:hypothetical protein [Hymenobacter mucosus]|uniref:Uncharacterized protein n=1 Tax=Hymenobacter mucosus TaxID=1411120 RepID=A0A239A871_9BACT|nr:hypothetical protein [Hymenobacter mucosus]SNR91856.1 hypothetical protein SAMN06269173_11157 [Hymenobacter mucosus]
MEQKRPLFPIYDIIEHWQAFAYSEPLVRPIHHALYYALVQMCKRRGGTQRFNLPYTDGMQASNIGSRNTYLTALRELETWGFVEYTPGANGLKAPIVHVKFCASAEHLVDIYRYASCASADTSAEHIIKEVKRLKDEGEEKGVVIENLQKEILQLKAQLAAQPSKSPDPAKQVAVALTDPADEQHWSEGPLTKPRAFQAICERLGFLDIDFEYYRRQALIAAEDNNISRTIAQWNSWVRNFFEYRLKAGPLLKPTSGQTLPSQPTPKDQLPKPGQEKPGQIIYIDGVPGDQNMDRMKAASYLSHFPAAVVVSLAYPQKPYQNKP